MEETTEDVAKITHKKDSKNAIFFCDVAGVVGFEPTKMSESESDALPLGDTPMYFIIVA